MPIDDWMTVLRDNMAAVDGMVQAHKYDELPGTLSAFPSVIILPTSGQQDYSAGGPNNAFHDVQITLYLANQISAEAHSLAIPFIEKVRNKLAGDITLNNTCVYCLPASAGVNFYEGPGGIQYGSKIHLGIIFRVVVKENETGDYDVAA